jgi:hypothetical protein
MEDMIAEYKEEYVTIQVVDLLSINFLKWR